MRAVRRWQLVGARGGQGTTTVATVVATLAAGSGPTTLAATRPNDVAALAGLATGSTPAAIAPGLDLVTAGETAPGAAVAAVEDLGRLSDLDGRHEAADGPETARWLVVRGPCYLSLRAALEAPWRPDGVVLVSEPGRSLSAADVVDVLGIDVVAEIPMEAAVARAVDAGLLLASLHRLGAFAALARLVDGGLGAGRPAPSPTDPTDLTPDSPPLPTDLPNHPLHNPPSNHPQTQSPYPPSHHYFNRETSSTDYAASSKLPPSGRRERRRPTAAASAKLLSGRGRPAPSWPAAAGPGRRTTGAAGAGREARSHRRARPGRRPPAGRRAWARRGGRRCAR